MKGKNWIRIEGAKKESDKNGTKMEVGGKEGDDKKWKLIDN